MTCRRHTALQDLKTPATRVGEVLSALAEGLDISATARVFGYRPQTIQHWLKRAGGQASRLHEHYVQHLSSAHLQADEIRVRQRQHVIWVWLVIDPVTKLIPVLTVGPRIQQMAHALIHELCQRLAPGCVPLFTTDGLNFYFYALTAHFGQWVAESGHRKPQWHVLPSLGYAQVQKNYRCRRLSHIKHLMRLGTPDQLQLALQAVGLSGSINTAFIERVNLTIRRGVSALARRTWATAQTAVGL